jgi:LysR family transcriptional regulator, glycine cleavage system transcriptional activator
MDLRLLNYDDFLILDMLLNNQTLTGIARELNLTQPAITQRMKKIETIFHTPLLTKSGRQLELTADGRVICLRAKKVIETLQSLDLDSSTKTVNIGSRPGVSDTWVWPCIRELHKTHPGTIYHLFIGSGDEIIQKLGHGSLDAVITSAPLTIRDYRAIEICEESYALVATPEIAQQIKAPKDLEKFVLIEHDRSFPFLRYLENDVRVKIRFSEVWFLQSTVIMLDAIAQGFGVGIVPTYLAQPAIKKGDIKKLNIKANLEADHFRIIYKTNNPRSTEIGLLAGALKKSGLR